MQRLVLLILCSILLMPTDARADVIAQVRAMMGRGQADAARQLIDAERSRAGVTPMLLEAMSWIARGELLRKQYDKAEAYAEGTYALAAPLFQKRQRDGEPHLPIAVGAAVEVMAQSIAARGESGKAVELLRREIGKYEHTAIAARLQKNLHLLTLEGKPAPELDVQHFVGPKPSRLAALRGHAVLLFFWADWCGDCKAQGPIIAALRETFAARGLVVLAPTQIYRGDEGTADAAPANATELAHINDVRRQFYPKLADVPTPVSAANFRSYGASTVPTLVLITPKGEVTLFHPGRMSYDELKSRIEALTL